MLFAVMYVSTNVKHEVIYLSNPILCLCVGISIAILRYFTANVILLSSALNGCFLLQQFIEVLYIGGNNNKTAVFNICFQNKIRPTTKQ